MANTKQTTKSSSQRKTPSGEQSRTAQKQQPLSGFSALSQQWDKR